MCQCVYACLYEWRTSKTMYFESLVTAHLEQTMGFKSDMILYTNHIEKNMTYNVKVTLYIRKNIIL